MFTVQGLPVNINLVLHPLFQGEWGLEADLISTVNIIDPVIILHSEDKCLFLILLDSEFIFADTLTS